MSITGLFIVSHIVLIIINTCWRHPSSSSMLLLLLGSSPTLPLAAMVASSSVLSQRLLSYKIFEPLLRILSSMSFYIVSSVPFPSSKDESSLPPEAEEGINIESSPPRPLEAIEPARPFINRVDGSPPRPRLQKIKRKMGQISERQQVCQNLKTVKSSGLSV